MLFNTLNELVIRHIMEEWSHFYIEHPFDYTHLSPERESIIYESGGMSSGLAYSTRLKGNEWKELNTGNAECSDSAFIN